MFQHRFHEFLGKQILSEKRKYCHLHCAIAIDVIVVLFIFRPLSVLPLMAHENKYEKQRKMVKYFIFAYFAFLNAFFH